MITEIPSPSDFQTTGLNHLYLAWQIAVRAVEDLDYVEDNVDLEDDGEKQAASSEYWAKSQPALANAFGLIQQAMEMSLKGRIAVVSPFLLIPRDPREWPKGVDTGAVPFSAFRTLDAADLLKVHNTFVDPPLDDEFRTFWEAVRRDRNKVMHSVSPLTFDPATLVRALLTAATALFAETRWPQRLLDMEADGKYAAYGMDDGSQNVVMRQIEIALRHLTPAESRLLLGYDKKRRSYVCPNCYDLANHDWQDSWPKLAQLQAKTPGDRFLHCVVCDATTEVSRLACNDAECEGDVLYEERCMTCLGEQDSPDNFRSELVDDSLGLGHEYRLSYQRTSVSATVMSRLLNDANAVEHCRLSMLAPYLSEWQSVTIWRHWAAREPGLERRRQFGAEEVGTWTRTDDGLEWRVGAEPDITGSVG